MHRIYDILDDKKVIVGVDLGIGGDKTVVSVLEVRGPSRKLKCQFVPGKTVLVPEGTGSWLFSATPMSEEELRGR